MKRPRLAAVIITLVFPAAGRGAGVHLASCGSTAPSPAAASTHGDSTSSYYRSMTGRLDSGSSGSSGMMGGTPSRSWMMGTTGYRWIMGGVDAPAWMRGQALPGFMMGTSSDPGTIMGALFANAPGLRISPAQATRLGGQMPAGATVSRTHHKITFSGTSPRLTILAPPPRGQDETLPIPGMPNPP